MTHFSDLAGAFAAHYARDEAEDSSMTYNQMTVELIKSLTAERDRYFRKAEEASARAGFLRGVMAEMIEAQTNTILPEDKIRKANAAALKALMRAYEETA